MRILIVIFVFLISSVAFGQTFKTYKEISQPKGWIVLNKDPLLYGNQFAPTYLLGNYKSNLKVLVKVDKPKIYKNEKREFDIKFKLSPYLESKPIFYLRYNF